MDYVQNKNELALVKAMETGKPFIDYKKEDVPTLIETIGVWAYYIGLSKAVTGDDMLILSKFIIQSYPLMTAEEVKIAVEYNAQGRFGEIQHYGVMSPAYVGKVISAYGEYRSETLRTVFERSSRSRPEETPPLSREENHAMMCQIIAVEYAKFINTGRVDDFFSIIYNFLKESGRLNLTDELQEKAKIYAEERVLADRRRKEDLDLSDAGRRVYIQDEKVAYKRGCRNYCVQDVFASITDIDEYIKGVKIEEF